jgi:hypothetical protein
MITLRLAFERKLDQTVNQLRVRQATRLPQLGVHADGSKARYRV